VDEVRRAYREIGDAMMALDPAEFSTQDEADPVTPEEVEAYRATVADRRP
jgi:hypothetical protein